MSKEIYISSTPHETRLAIVEKDELTEIYYERENEYTLAGSIYNGKVTRVLPGMQSSFVDIGLERDAFLYITDFMEEAGDSAEFEGSHGGGGRSRGERPREQTRRDESAPREEMRSAEARRSSESGRSSEFGRQEAGRQEAGRGESGRGRGRRGRGDRDRRPARTEAASTDALTAARNDVAAPVAMYDGGEEAVESTAFVVGSDFDTEEVGEGAPGADGTRRWRGRRGRRRGRSGGETVVAGEDESLPQVTPLKAIDAVGEDSLDETSSVFVAREPEVRQPKAAHEVKSAATPRDSSGDGGRERGRGRRGRDRRDRNRNDREGQVEAPLAAPVAAAPAVVPESRQEGVRERFAPRGARGRDRGADRASDRSSDRNGAREEQVPVVAVSAAAEPEPFLLPGESLSKYRKGDAQAESSAPKTESIAMARPSTEVQPITGWDGGAVLPGETLSRRPAAPSGNAPGVGREAQGGGEGRGRRRDRDERQGRGGRGEQRGDRSSRQEFSSRRMDPAEAVQPAVTTGHDLEPATQGLVETHPDSETALHAQHATHAMEMYEAQTDSVPGEVHSTHATEAVEEFHETVAEYEPDNDASASFRVDPVPVSEFRQSAVVEEVPVAEAAHDLTHLSAEGEMHSETPSVVEHEAQEAAGSSESAGAAADSKHFAPGHGELEEELIDDEETEVAPKHVSAIHAGASEELDEEALEHAADLSSMLRDMSIDDITGPEPVELSDEDDEEFGAEEELDEEEMEEDELASDEGESRTQHAGEPDHAAHSEAGAAGAAGETEVRRREGGRRGRRDGRRGRDRGERSGSERPAGERTVGEPTADEPSVSAERGVERNGERERSSGDRERSFGERSSSGSRDRRGMANGRGRSGGRQSVQTMDLPAISDLLKPGQEVLVQIAKEPIAKKGARITSHIALPGRFLVFMPTVHHTGVSRKIESDGERRRLKEILLSERGDASGGFIVRTAAQGASEEELRSDLRFLLNLWADIKARSESSKSPALIYHDLNLVERILRDQVTDNFSAIWVDTEVEYERVVRFLQRFQPALVRRVKLYGKDVPLFEQFGITEEINKALRSKVWLKSGGSIVINQTEALVAIDVNTGKFVGKTARLEDTIVKTNLDAIPEIVRQMRLRDLGGIIIIDFIDMEERKNRNRVMAALEEELKSDRAPSKVLQFNDFGLVAITRKRVKQSLERTLSTTCGVCAGTGMVKSPVTVCNDIYVEMRKMHKVFDKGDIMLRVNPEVVKQLKTGGAKWLQEMEEMSGKTILVKSDPSLHPEQFDIH